MFHMGFRLMGIIILDISQMPKSLGKMPLRRVIDGMPSLT